jgi:hypothetical protein
MNSRIATIAALCLLAAACARRAGPGVDAASSGVGAGSGPTAETAEASGTSEGSGASEGSAPVAVPTPRAVGAFVDAVARSVRGFDPNAIQVIAAARALNETHTEEAARADFVARCDAGEGPACHVAGALAADGSAAGMDTLLRRWQRACELGEELSCSWLASTVLQTGRGEMVVDFLGPSCRPESDIAVQPAACTALAWSQWSNDPVAAPEAAARFAEICAGGYAAACRYRGDALTQMGDSAGALAAWNDGCEAGHGGSCIAWALARRTANDLDFRPLERACERGYGAGCLGAAVTRIELGETATDGSPTSDLLQRGCLLEQTGACELLAEQLFYAESDRLVGLVRSTPWWVTGCNLGGAESCWRFATLLLSVDNEADAALIADLRQRACNGGIREACAAAQQ